MLRALLLCELIEQIDAAATTSPTEPTSAADVGKIRNALGRLDDGTYGVCECCSQSIPLEDLRRQPKTSVCRLCGPNIREMGNLPDAQPL